MPTLHQPEISVDSYFDRIFYINLDTDTARNENMIKQFEKLGIKNYERVPAIRLNELSPQDSYRNFIKLEPKYIIGSLSCRASHLLCVNIAKEREYSKILILEDDVVFLQDPTRLLAMNQNMLNEWDMLYFGGLVETHFRNQIVCSHAYAIKHTLFDDIIQMADCSGMEIDNFYAKILHHMSYNYNQSGKYNIRIILPFNQIVQNKSLGSSIQ